MAAHVLYTAWDEERAASVSTIVIEEIIRARIGFDGLLLSDDLGMEALSGPMAERGAAAIAAGCDLALHCSGIIEEAQALAAALGPASSFAAGRLDRAMERVVSKAATHSIEILTAQRDALLAGARL
jgi:beta-N-acetylhexosaminidase